MAESNSRKPWVWICLASLLVLFASGIFYLDRKIVKNSQENAVKETPDEQREKPKIDFYTVLENREVEIPVSDEEIEGIKNPTRNKSEAEKLILQVGSFQSAGAADSLKAQLAFLGLEAKVHSALVNDSTWYRVQIGPFESNSKVSRAKNLLLENKIQYSQRSVVQ